MSDDIAAQVLGSLITLLGVLVALRYSQQNFITTLQHEREKAKDERQFETKRAAYLEAVEATARFVQYFAIIPDMKGEDMHAHDPAVANFGVAISKMHLFADIKTIEKLSTMYTTVLALLTDVMSLKVPVLKADGDIGANNSTIETWKTANQNLQAEINELMGVDPSSPHITNARQQLAHNFGVIATAHAENSIFYKQKVAATGVCRKAVIAALPRMQEAMGEVLVAARTELGFRIDAERYAALTTELNARAKKNFEGFIDDVNQQFKLED